ncbi:hypothetical protein B0H10DRAFT_323170 [Mycena sp. CBHHK59/15]|nr:hypothetical protein B0H10DRAFT_323170 [Mycena sp. CBHHK59/15]
MGLYAPPSPPPPPSYPTRHTATARSTSGQTSRTRACPSPGRPTGRAAASGTTRARCSTCSACVVASAPARSAPWCSARRRTRRCSRRGVLSVPLPGDGRGAGGGRGVYRFEGVCASVAAWVAGADWNRMEAIAEAGELRRVEPEGGGERFPLFVGGSEADTYTLSRFTIYPKLPLTGEQGLRIAADVPWQGLSLSILTYLKSLNTVAFSSKRMLWDMRPPEAPPLRLH